MASLIRADQPEHCGSTSFPPIRTGHQPTHMDAVESGLLREATQADRAAKLKRTIEVEIIPRLMLLQAGAALCVPSECDSLTALDVEEFAQIVVHSTLGRARAHVDQLIERGLALETIFLDLMGPAARRLGDLWTADELGFAEVTIGLSHLQQLLRHFSPSFESELEEPANCGRAMLLPARTEQHTFGLYVLDCFLRRAGWEVEIESRSEACHAVGRVSSTWFDVIGLSAGCDVLIDELASDIRSLRRASRNQSVGIMVGGPAFLGHPDRVARVGADGTAEDAPRAVLLARCLLMKSARRSGE